MNTTRVLRRMMKVSTRCFYCRCQLHHPDEGKEPRATIDHFIPKSKGGNNGPHNLRLACPSCNMAKGDNMPKGDNMLKLTKTQKKVMRKHAATIEDSDGN